MSQGAAPRQGPDPIDELLLAQALDMCLHAERVVPGSSAPIVERAPDSARPELSRLLETARALEVAAAGATPSPEFKAAARARLIRRVTGAPDEPTQPIVLTSIAGRGRARRGRPWLLRGLGGLLAAGLSAAATLTASASALPGEPLYSVKQAKEEVALRLAADDQARALALLVRANARLDETTRLLQQGRTQDALQTALRYDESIDRATSTLVTAIGPQASSSPAVEQFATELAAQQMEIENVLPAAPAEAKAELREALRATERGRALAANPAPVKEALAQAAPATLPVPLIAQPRAEEQPTELATHTPVPAPAVVVQRPAEPEPEVARVEEHRDDRGAEREGPGNGEAVATRGEGDDGGRSSGPGPRRAPPPQSARLAAERLPSTSGPSEQQRGGGEERPADRLGVGDPRSGGEDAPTERVALGEPHDSGEATLNGGAEGERVRGAGEDGRRGASQDEARGGDKSDRRGGEAEPQRPAAPANAGPPSAQVRAPDDAADAQRGAPRTGSESGPADSGVRATTPVAPAPANTTARGNADDSAADGGDQRNGRRSSAADPVLTKPTTAQPTTAQPSTAQPTATPQPTRAPTATPTPQPPPPNQASPGNQQNAHNPSGQSPQQQATPQQNNNNNSNSNRGSGTSTSGARSGTDDGNNKGANK